MIFNSLDDFSSKVTCGDLPSLFEASKEAALERTSNLTKPKGSLGRLEELAIWYLSWKGVDADVSFDLPKAKTLVFAANHGIATRGVSAFPVEVTEQMVVNFERGGAAINQLCNCVGSSLEVYSINSLIPTKDFTQEAAMTHDECCSALSLGWDKVTGDEDVLVFGEMGIGNTTSAAALYSALFNSPAKDYAGVGTGIDENTLNAKINVIDEGVKKHNTDDHCEVLRCLGGFEIAAMAGAILSARYKRVPVILDGFINCASAAILHSLNPRALDHCVAGHLSNEGGHRKVLDRFKKDPILSLKMRLGEGTGGVLAIAILKAALSCHIGMSTFEEAMVSISGT